ncbi:MAG: hypothetical protein QM619_08930 [Micropruina sp.]|uniref:hypothetical protein n=1 Tax=Micropruina sp. TaxID=2737536 RepID=UPI0039E2ADA1
MTANLRYWSCALFGRRPPFILSTSIFVLGSALSSFAIGLGLGQLMQTLTMAIQAAALARDIGAATGSVVTPYWVGIGVMLLAFGRHPVLLAAAATDPFGAAG